MTWRIGRIDGPSIAPTTEGPCNIFERSVAQSVYAKSGANDKPNSDTAPSRTPVVIFEDETGRRWKASGKLGRVLLMLATTPEGITQWDCLPWHTRLAASIHTLREMGLPIETLIEGEYHHARYRLLTPGRIVSRDKVDAPPPQGGCAYAL